MLSQSSPVWFSTDICHCCYCHHDIRQPSPGSLALLHNRPRQSPSPAPQQAFLQQPAAAGPSRSPLPGNLSPPNLLLSFLLFYPHPLFIFLIILLLFNYSCLHFSPPQPNLPPSPASTLPLGFVHVSFIVVPENPSPHCLLPPPLWLLLDCS